MKPMKPVKQNRVKFLTMLIHNTIRLGEFHKVEARIKRGLLLRPTQK